MTNKCKQSNDYLPVTEQGNNYIPNSLLLS